MRRIEDCGVAEAGEKVGIGCVCAGQRMARGRLLLLLLLLLL